MPKKEILVKHNVIFPAYLLIVWGFYRMLFKLPEEVEEIIIKPILWILPLIFLLKREKLGAETVGITSNNLFPSIYIALILGVIFAIEGLLVNFVKYEGIEFAANIGKNSLIVSLFISLATAVSEEFAFRGYLFNRTWFVMGNELKANLLVSLVWAAIHIPITVFWWQLSPLKVVGYLILTTLFAIGSSFIFARTRNLAGSILLHILWSWPIVLFR